MKRKARIHPSQGVRRLYSPAGTAPQPIPLSFLLCQLQPTGTRLLGLLREPRGLLGQCSCLGPQPQPQRAPLAPINLLSAAHLLTWGLKGLIVKTPSEHLECRGGAHLEERGGGSQERERGLNGRALSGVWGRGGAGEAGRN